MSDNSFPAQTAIRHSTFQVITGQFVYHCSDCTLKQVLLNHWLLLYPSIVTPTPTMPY